jgi:acetolactate synthase-1/3 small subunit
MNDCILSVLVSNYFGVLTRVTSLFGRRGFNIKALTVGETEDPEFSRITIVTEADEQMVSQITKQLGKLEDVKHVAVLSHGPLVGREMLLIKLHSDPYDALMQAVTRGARLLSIGSGYVIFEYTGNSAQIDEFIREMREFNIIELCRTGLTALQDEKDSIYQK